MSRSGSMLFSAFQATSLTFCTSTSSSTTTMHLLNMACPNPQIACITLRACSGYDLRIATRIKLWKLQAHQRQKDSFDRFAHVEVFHRRRTDDGSGVDRIFAAGDALDVEHR